MQADDPKVIASGLTKPQRLTLIEVCRTNGGGVQISCRVLDDGEVVPSSIVMRKLFEKGLIQGKSGAYETVVHTREGLAVRNILISEGQDQ